MGARYMVQEPFSLANTFLGLNSSGGAINHEVDVAYDVNGSVYVPYRHVDMSTFYGFAGSPIDENR